MDASIRLSRKPIALCLAIAALVALAVTAACSGGDEPSTSTAAASPPRAAASLPASTAATAAAASGIEDTGLQPTPASAPEPDPTATAAPPPEPTSAPAPTPAPTATPEAPDEPVLPVTVTDATGNEVTVEDISRIVVLNGDITEVVYALGLGDNIVAVDSSATYPEEALALPKVGYQRSLSAEGILSMDPTVIIGNTRAGPPEVIEQIRAAGVPVVVVEPAETLEGVSTKILGVAEALGVMSRGQAIVEEVEAQIVEVREQAAKAEDKPVALFLYMRGLDTLFLIGTAHITHELFEASGAISGAAVAGIHAPFIPLTAEALVAANPDCILVFTLGLQSVGGIEGLKGIPGVAETTAAQEGCIHAFDDQYMGGGGPRTGELLQELLELFQPDLADAE